MSSIITTTDGVAVANRRAQLVTEAIVSAYIRQIASPRRHADMTPARRERSRVARWAPGHRAGRRHRGADGAVNLASAHGAAASGAAGRRGCPRPALGR